MLVAENPNFFVNYQYPAGSSLYCAFFVAFRSGSISTLRHYDTNCLICFLAHPAQKRLAIILDLCSSVVLLDSLVLCSSQNTFYLSLQRSPSYPHSALITSHFLPLPDRSCITFPVHFSKLFSVSSFFWILTFLTIAIITDSSVFSIQLLLILLLQFYQW